MEVRRPNQRAYAACPRRETSKPILEELAAPSTGAAERAHRDRWSESAWVDAVTARETPEDGLVIDDGHMRSGLDADVKIPVLVLDIDEDEAAEVLATFDPISAMAEYDEPALRSLIASIPGAESLRALSTCRSCTAWRLWPLAPATPAALQPPQPEAATSTAAEPPPLQVGCTKPDVPRRSTRVRDCA